MQGVLPNFLKFKTIQDLVRIGRDHDGGYLVSQSDIENSDILIGLGINDDWSFESDFVKHKKVPIIAYDASVGNMYFIKMIMKSIFMIYNPTNLFHWLKVFISYNIFFTKQIRHIEKFVGLDADGPYCTMDDVLNETDSNNIFFKIDIEGSEYRSLDILIKNAHRISGLVIEFHAADINLPRIKEFVDKFSLNLVHVHANNLSRIRNTDGLPLVLEMTFSKYGKLSETFASLPHKFDMPNLRTKKEISLTFKIDK